MSRSPYNYQYQSVPYRAHVHWSWFAITARLVLPHNHGIPVLTFHRTAAARSPPPSLAASRSRSPPYPLSLFLSLSLTLPPAHSFSPTETPFFLLFSRLFRALLPPSSSLVSIFRPHTTRTGDEDVIAEHSWRTSDGDGDYLVTTCTRTASNANHNHKITSLCT